MKVGSVPLWGQITPLRGDKPPPQGQVGHVQAAHFLGGVLQAGMLVAQALHQRGQHLALVLHCVLQELIPMGGRGENGNLEMLRAVEHPTGQH